VSAAIAYYPNLIEDLEREHRELLSALSSMSKSVQIRNLKRFKEYLAVFKNLLVEHLLKEAVKLYIYLRQTLKAHPAESALVSRYKKEMDGLGVEVLRFIDHYLPKSATEIDVAALKAELVDVANLLKDRLSREETELYPLYLPAAERVA
jgi:hemerythrin-like domain-containing protein